MPKPLRLSELGLLARMPAHLSSLWRQRPDEIMIEQIEVLPQQRKWVIHLSGLSAQFSPAQSEWNPLTEWIKEQTPELAEVEVRCRCRAEGGALASVCRERWPEIVRDWLELLPMMKGWLTVDAPYQTEGSCLTLTVPNALHLEYLKTKGSVLEQYFLRAYGIQTDIRCLLDEQQSPEESREECLIEAEIEEMKYVEQLKLPEPSQESKKRPPALILGRSFQGESRSLTEVQEEESKVVVQGQVVKLEQRKLKTGRQLLTFDLCDPTGAISAKLFLDENAPPLALREGQWVSIRGTTQFDRYTSELTLLPRDIVLSEHVVRRDEAADKRVELHLHTRMSSLDGVSSAADMVQRAAYWGHTALAITDHGVVQAFPEAIEAGEKHGVKIIMGVEGYLVDDTPGAFGNAALRQKKSNHIIILVKNPEGLKNLYRLITYSHLEHYYRRPRIPRSLLTKHRAGLIIGSACESGELFQAVLADKPLAELTEIASYYDYLEIQPIGNNAFLIHQDRVADEAGLRELNRRIWRLGSELGKPVVATGDVHFLDPEDHVYRQILMAGKGFEDADNQAPLYYRTTQEMLDEFSYLGGEAAYQVVVQAPRQIAGQTVNMKPFPEDLHSPSIPGAEDQIKNMSWEQAYALYGDPLPDIVRERLEKELNSIIGNGFSVLYLIAHLLVKKSNEDGYIVGSRGSVGSSLVATLIGITEVNPLAPHYRCPNDQCLHAIWMDDGKSGSGADLPDQDCPRCGARLLKAGYDIPFETFLGFEGDKVPDIDLNFSGEYQARAHKYTEELFGKEYVFRAGTIATIASKTAYGFVKNYLDERGLKTRSAETDRLVRGCSGVKRTTGQHPGGLMVVPKECDVFDFTPLQRPADDTKSDTITTHFDYHSISGRLVKLDILGHDSPTIIKMLEDMTGENAALIPLDDRQVMSLFSSPQELGVTSEQIDAQTGTFGVPEFGTKFVRQMLEDAQPKSFSDLIRISGLSHGTDVWLGNAQEVLRSGQAGISEIIACRDDIMVYLIYRGLEASRAFKIMENVRKGKGLKEDDIAEMLQYETPQWYLDSCQKIKYMFPKAHAVAYVIMSFRIAWFKIHYPAAFYAASFTVRAGDFDADLIIQGREVCQKKIKEIEGKGNEASAKEKGLISLLELAVEMDCRGVPLHRVDLWASDAAKFTLKGAGILPPLVALQGLGDTAAQNIVRVREAGSIRSVEDLTALAHLTKNVVEILQQHGCLEGLPEENQLSLF
ncbi:MAG: PolC-type DNA polymerase III [Peptococcaceae bacterium]|jgi:DNA polymerase-3 subunit alpha (Gram-positive type)|nr:PolC-type DNA polymerase III [Peptococcaceae bacterium]